MNFWMF